MKVGHAREDISPVTDLTLSGFASRCNLPSVGIHDRLSVRAVVLAAGDRSVLVLVYDLLGLGPEITRRIHRALDDAIGSLIPESQRILCATHTHSAPAAIRLIGCGVMEESYLELLVERTVATARSALVDARNAYMRTASVTLPERNYNRRTVLTDGRVIMGRGESLPVAKVGPTWEEVRLLRFEDAHGDAIVGIVNWAAHATTQSSQYVSGDYPAELCRQLELQQSFPYVYLQGAAGNINPGPVAGGFAEMHGYVRSIVDHLTGASWSEPVDPADLEFCESTVTLDYAPVPERDALDETRRAMEEIAETGTGDPEEIATINNILNVPPGGEGEPTMLRYTAGILRDWAAGTAASRESAEGGCPLSVKALRVGDIALLFVAAEVFVETARELRRRFPEANVILVAYGSPLVGYLPTDEALAEGGYEARYAYRFYGHPAAFAVGSEPRFVEAAFDGIRNLFGRT